jgi:glutamine amidotransferase
MIAVLDYDTGNIKSVLNALEDLSVDYKVTNLEKEICDAEKVIFPGVGEASFAVKKLHMTNLFNLLSIIKNPILGICLGMQLLSDKSVEGDVTCLGVIPVTTQKFNSDKVKVPHMGWNKVKIISDSKLFSGIADNSYFYFAHSYFVPMNEFTVGTSMHDEVFTSVCEKDNFYGVQFHPEKSSEQGIKLLRNFIELC